MRRRLLIIAAFLLAGAVVNVAVAWGIALRVTDSGPLLLRTYVRGPDEWWIAWRYSGFGSSWIRSQQWCGEPSSYFLPDSAAAVTRPNPTSDPRNSAIPPSEIMPDWPGLRIPTSEFEAGLLRYQRRTFEGRGWPALSMWCEDSRLTIPFVLDSPNIEAAKDAIATPFGKGAYGLPLRPIWPGFAISTTFYAAVLWLPFGPFALWRFIRRRRGLIRRRRGLCPECAYPLGESSLCTECGRELAT